MKPEEAFEYLECPCDRCGTKNFGECEYSCNRHIAYEAACDALKKQIPKKVGFDKHYGEYICPECNSEVDEYKADGWCPSCGRRLDWSDVR